jgi:hypothetical protein
MKTIWKFEDVQLSDTTMIEVRGATVLQWLRAVPTSQTGHVTVWARVNVFEAGNAYKEIATFECRGTGAALTGLEGKHFDTVIDHQFVWHLFQGT